jgi:hypothetical protein
MGAGPLRTRAPRADAAAKPRQNATISSPVPGTEPDAGWEERGRIPLPFPPTGDLVLNSGEWPSCRF